MNNKQTRGKKDKSVLIIVIVALILVVAATYFIMSPIKYKNDFENFKADFTKTINSAKESGAVLVTQDGKTHKANEYVLSDFYWLLTGAGIGVPTKQVPESPILIDFPDGAEMTLGEVEVERGSRKGRMCMYISFKNDKGKVFTYYHDMIDLRAIEGL